MVFFLMRKLTLTIYIVLAIFIGIILGIFLGIAWMSMVSEGLAESISER